MTDPIDAFRHVQPIEPEHVSDPASHPDLYRITALATGHIARLVKVLVALDPNTRKAAALASSQPIPSALKGLICFPGSTVSGAPPGGLLRIHVKGSDIATQFNGTVRGMILTKPCCTVYNLLFPNESRKEPK